MRPRSAFSRVAPNRPQFDRGSRGETYWGAGIQAPILAKIVGRRRGLRIGGEKFLVAIDADGCDVVRTPYTNGVLWSGADLIPAAIADWKAAKTWKSATVDVSFAITTE